jgi:hypothetical protein
MQAEVRQAHRELHAKQNKTKQKQNQSLRKFRELSSLASATNKGPKSHNHERNHERINGLAEPR